MEMQNINDNEENLRNNPLMDQVDRKGKEVNSISIRNCDSPLNGAETQSLYLKNQLWAACAVSMGSLNDGFSIGFVNSAVLGIKESFDLPWEQAVWVANIILLGSVMGTLAAAVFIEYCGRQRTIIGATVPYFVGWIVIACATNLYMVFAGRIIIGISKGIISLAIPIYIGESVQPELRGALGLLPDLFLNVGILLATVIGIYCEWSKLAIFGVALSVVFLLPVMRIAESPRWYMAKGRSQDSRNALQWLRGYNINIEKEIEDITRFRIELYKRSGNICGNLFKIEYMSVVIICLGLMLFHQFSAINLVILTLVRYVHRVAGRSHEMLSHFIVIVVNLISSVIIIVFIDRIGRKMLLYISSVSMIICLVILGIYTYIKESYLDTIAYNWIPILCLVTFVLGYSIGFGPISFLMLGEILPLKIRGTAAALATGFNWIFGLYTVETDYNVTSAFSKSGTYWFYAVWSFIGLLFVKFFVPETRGRSLEEIEKELTGEPLDYEEC